MTSVALAFTVRNERDLLRLNILYHKYLGVTRFYVYLDGTTDDTRDTVKDFDGVVLNESISGKLFLESHERREACAASPSLRAALEKAAHNHTARQVLNTYMACEVARNSGIEWLVSLDADELVWPGTSFIEEGQLVEELDRLEGHVEQVRFRPLEVIPRRYLYQNVFREAVYFKRFGSRVRRDVYDPFAKKRRSFEPVPTRYHRLGLYKVRRFSWWYGHRRGKWAVRLGPLIAPSIHECCRLDGRPLQTVQRFYVLHYMLYDCRDFKKKHVNIKDQPDTGISGSPVPYRKRLWRDMVNSQSLSERALIEYYNEWVAFEDAEIERLRRKERADGESEVIEVTAIRDVFVRIEEAGQSS